MYLIVPDRIVAEELRRWARQRGIRMVIERYSRRYKITSVERVDGFAWTNYERACSVEFLTPSDELRHGDDFRFWLGGHTVIEQDRPRLSIIMRAPTMTDKPFTAIPCPRGFD